MALTFLLIRIFEQGFILKLISTSILSIYGKITSPEPLTEKRHAKQFTDPPLSPKVKSPSSYSDRFMRVYRTHLGKHKTLNVGAPAAKT